MATEAQKAAVSASSKALWADPVRRAAQCAAISAGLRKRWELTRFNTDPEALAAHRAKQKQIKNYAWRLRDAGIPKAERDAALAKERRRLGLT